MTITDEDLQANLFDITTRLDTLSKEIVLLAKLLEMLNTTTKAIMNRQNLLIKTVISQKT